MSNKIHWINIRQKKIHDNLILEKRQNMYILIIFFFISVILDDLRILRFQCLMKIFNIFKLFKLFKLFKMFIK